MATPSTSERPSTSPADLGLSSKQVEVLALLMQGKSNKAICRALNLAEPTVKYHITTILKALKVANRTEAVLAVGKLGWKLPLPVADAPRSESSDSPERSEAVSATGARSHANKAARPPEGDSKPALPLPDKPSIVVLPFANLSGDPSQDYFADGMVEDITVALGSLPWLFVIGSSSAFTYKGRAVDLRQVGSELGVRYALGGSVRKEGNRVRITAQLADTSHGGHVWADRFDGELNSVFEMQDRVASHVSTTIAPALHSEEIERVRRKPTEQLTAYDLILRASANYRNSKDNNTEALRLAYKAVELDPLYGSAYGLAAWCYYWQKIFGWAPPKSSQFVEGMRLANLAAEFGKNDSEAVCMAGHTMLLLAGEIDRSLAQAERAVSLNPNSANGWWLGGTARVFGGDSEAAFEHFAQAQRLNPLDPFAQPHWMAIAVAHFLGRRYDEAENVANKLLREHADFPPALRMNVAICGLLGRREEGRDYVRRLLAVNPDATVVAMRDYYEPLLRRHPGGLENYLNGLRLSGLPEARS